MLSCTRQEPMPPAPGQEPASCTASEPMPPAPGPGPEPMPPAAQNTGALNQQTPVMPGTNNPPQNTGMNANQPAVMGGMNTNSSANMSGMNTNSSATMGGMNANQPNMEGTGERPAEQEPPQFGGTLLDSFNKKVNGLISAIGLGKNTASTNSGSLLIEQKGGSNKVEEGSEEQK